MPLQRIRRFRIRFSLRTLLFVVLTIGALGALSLKWEPWQAVLVLNPGGTFVKEASFSPDGKFIVTHSSLGDFGGNSRTVVWDRDGREVYRTEWCLDMGASGYDGAKFVLNGRYLCMRAAHHRSHSQLVDLRTFKMIFDEERGAACFPAFSMDEKRCAVHFQDMYGKNAWLGIYDLEQGAWIFEERAYFEAKKDLRSAQSIAISPDGKYVAALCVEDLPGGHIDSHLMVMDLESKTTRSCVVKPAEEVVFTTDGARVALRGMHSFALIDIATMKVLYDQRDLSGVAIDFSNAGEGIEFATHSVPSGVVSVNLLEAEPKAEPINGAQPPWRLAGEWAAWFSGSELTLQNLKTGRRILQKVKRSAVSEADPSAPQWWHLSDVKSELLINGGDFEPLIFNTASEHFSSRSESAYISPDGLRKYRYTENHGEILALPERDVRGIVPSKKQQFYMVDWSPDSQTLLKPNGETVEIWSRVRSDEPWALAWLPELWLSLAFGTGLVWSLCRDWRRV